MSTLHLLVIATNAYAIFGWRLLTDFAHFYRGSLPLVFHLFGDEDPLCQFGGVPTRFYPTTHGNWCDATNSKFRSVLAVRGVKPDDYLYYCDADTLITAPFDESWLLGELVAARHWISDQPYDTLPFDSNTRSRCYVERKPGLTYYYGAFWGGRYAKVADMCRVCEPLMRADLSEGYDAAVNDESYANWYFTHTPPDRVITQFPFSVSDKAGLLVTRDASEKFEGLRAAWRAARGERFGLKGGKLYPNSR